MASGGPQINANTTAVQLEKVRSKVPMLYERDDVLISKILKKGEKVSNRSARIPLQLRPGGAPGLYNPDGGNMGRGTATYYDVATISTSHFKFGVEMTHLAEIGVDSPEKAVLNVVKAEVKNGMAGFRSFLDKVINQSSTGELGAVGSIAGAVITLKTSGTGSSFSANQRFLVGQYLNGVNTGATALLNSGDHFGPISVVNNEAGKITLDSNSFLPTTNDRLFVDGSTFDVVTTNAATSSTLLGVAYQQSSAQTGSWLSFNRANYPEVWTPEVGASSALLTTAMIRTALNKIRLKLGVDSIGSLVSYCNPKQTHAYEDLGIMISEIHKGGSQEGMDLFFDVNKSRMAGVPMLESLNADPTRIDFLDLSKWGRVVTEDVDFYQTKDGQTVFPVYGTDGAPAASQLFYYVTSFQVFNESPSSGAYISSLAVPSTY